MSIQTSTTYTRRRLEEKIKAKMAQIGESLVLAPADDLLEYRERVSAYNTLRDVITMMEELEKS